MPKIEILFGSDSPTSLKQFCRDGVWELIIDHGPGYRVYYSMIGGVVVLLLCAGSKSTQNRDISRAVKYLKRHKEASTS